MINKWYKTCPPTINNQKNGKTIWNGWWKIGSRGLLPLREEKDKMNFKITSALEGLKVLFRPQSGEQDSKQSLMALLS